MKHRTTKTNAGFSLVEMLVAVAILGIVALAVMMTTSNSLTQMGGVFKASETEELRRYLLSAVDCEKTMRPPGSVPGACASLGPAVARDKSGAAVVATPFTTFGKGYKARASCTPEASSPRRQLTLEVQKPGSSTWTPLYTDGLSLCPGLPSPEWVTAYGNLEIDPLELAMYLVWVAQMIATGTSTFPVLVSWDSDPNFPAYVPETTALYEGAARCPRGYTAVTGGVDCSSSTDGTQQIAVLQATASLTQVRRFGYKIESSRLQEVDVWHNWMLQPSDRGFTGVDYWHGKCGMLFRWIPMVEPLSVRGGRVFATCKRNGTL